MRFGRTHASAAVLIFILVAFSSLLWSVLPMQTISRLSILIFSTTLYLLVSSLYSINDILTALRNTLLFFIVFGLIIYFLDGAYVETFDWTARNFIGRQALTGLFEHNVFAGVASVFAILIVLTVPFRSTVLQAGSVCSCVVFLALTDSASALAIAAAAVPIWICLRLLQMGPHARLTGIGLGILLVAFAAASVLNLDSVSVLFGRSGDLTGRTPLWTSALGLLDQRPFTGWGYGSVFGPEGAAARLGLQIGRGYWVASHFHNDYLQVLVELGPLGLAAISALLWVALVPAAGLGRNSQIEVVRLLVLLTAAFALTGEIFAAQKFGWFLLVVASTYNAKLARTRAPSQRPTQTVRP
jgi:exopolysaccharide production protein ExoQ